jgi:hypothetical protein
VVKPKRKPAARPAPAATPVVPPPTVAEHFEHKPPELRAIYDGILDAIASFGRFTQDSKKTSIHLTYRSAFAGVALRNGALILTLKSARDIKSPRVYRAEQVSAHRWHVEIRLNGPAEVDRELKDWLRQAYELGR